MIFRCPVCQGSGLVPAGFYAPVPPDSTTAAKQPREKCKTCDGVGILYDNEEEETRK